MRTTGGLTFSILNFRQQWYAVTENKKLPDGGIEGWKMAVQATGVLTLVMAGTQAYHWFGTGTPNVDFSPGAAWAGYVALFLLLVLIGELLNIHAKKKKLEKISFRPGSTIPVDLFWGNYPLPKAKMEKELVEFLGEKGYTDPKNLIVECVSREQIKLFLTATKDGKSQRFWTDGIELHDA